MKPQSLYLLNFITKRPSAKHLLFLTLGFLLGITSPSVQEAPVCKNEKGCEDHRLMNRVVPYA